MKSYRAFAWKELRTQKVTSILILIAVILSAMMTTVVGQSIGILNAMRGDQSANLNGNRYVTLHQLTMTQADVLSGDHRLSYAESMISLGTAKLPNNISLKIREYIGNALSAYESISQVESGRLPEAVGEIALPRDVLNMLGFQGKLGDTISLDLNISLLHDTDTGYDYSHSFVLTGILKANYIGYVSGTVMGMVGQGTANPVLPEKYLLYSVDIRTTDKKTFQRTVDDLVQTYSIPDYCIQYNDTLLSALGINYRDKNSSDTASGFSFMTLAGLLIGTLVLLAAGLVIYNILKISITNRVKEYGTLRAIGADRGKLYTIVSLQLLILCGIGIPVGAGLGLLSAKGITIAATSILSPEIFMADSQSELSAMIAENSGGKILPLIVSGSIALLFAFVAAMPAARYAAKVPPTIAMSGRIAAVKRRSRKMGRIRCFEAFYARMNMRRNPGRTSITILSLVMSITVFVALQSFSGLLDASQSIQKMHLGDYSVTNQATGFSPEEVETLSSVPGVHSVFTLKYKLYMPDDTGRIADVNLPFAMQPGETLQVVGIDAQRIQPLIASLSSQDLQALKDGSACIIKNPVVMTYGDMPMTATKINTGDTISINGKSLKVLGTIDDPVTVDNGGFTNGVQVIVYDTVYNQFTGDNHYTELYPVLSDRAVRDTVEQVISSLCDRTGGTWVSYENTDQQLQESYEQIRVLAWGLILFIGLIGVLNIINTVYTNIHTRVTEIGVQRAIGMSVGSLYKTFLWEGAYYGIVAAVLGGVAGYVCTIFVNAAATDTIQLVAIPVLPLVEAAVLSVAACLVATCVPLKKIAEMNIVESIEAVE